MLPAGLLLSAVAGPLLQPSRTSSDALLTPAAAVLRHAFNGTWYDPSEPPEGVTVVEVAAVIDSVAEFDTAGTYEMTLRTFERWHDARLRWDSDEFGVLSVGHLSEDLPWAPDTQFLQGRVLTRRSSVLRLRHTGQVTRERHSVVLFTCDMKFLYYPFDTQRCAAGVQSAAHSGDTMRYVLPGRVPGLRLDPGAVLAVGRYQFMGHDERVDCEPDPFEEGSCRSAIRWTITWQREARPAVLTVFTPLWLVVLSSCAGLWIDAAAAPARVSISVTTLLILISLMFVITGEIVAVPYITLMDTYFVVCFIVVTLNVVEYVVVNRLNQRLAQREKEVTERRKNLEAMVSVVKNMAADGLEGHDSRVPLETPQPNTLIADMPRVIQPPPPGLLADGDQVVSEPSLPAPTPPSPTADAGVKAAEIALSLAAWNTDVFKTSDGRMMLNADDDVPDPPSDSTRERNSAPEKPDEVAPEMLAELQDAFRLFDQDRSGAITVGELVPVLRSMGCSDAAIRNMVRKFDDDNSGRIEFLEFVEIMRHHTDLRGVPQAFAREARAIRIFATVRGGIAVTPARVQAFEVTYRRVVSTSFVAATFMWMPAAFFGSDRV
eukprot:TRINITY_DN10474_c0_g1_i1.p1 TRINITY_DN10474_c0_g1~~TRINITY_DN10474_c0_g1_i1.p1  ORF type:complete len:628 (+),score=186.83 TRINITY_DN10474_c0_g1_i1:73-1884(+)